MTSKTYFKLMKQKGFTLLESLLTLFILSIGLMGMAGLHIQSMRSGGVAMQRISIAIKVDELLERMRNNAENSDALLSYSASGSGVGGSNNGCHAGAACTPTQMAANDIFLWSQDLGAMVPTLTNWSINASPANTVDVTVTWQDRGDTHTYVVTTLIKNKET